MDYSIIFYILLYLLIIFGTGIGFALVILPKEKSNLAFFLAPLASHFLINLVAWNIYYFDGPALYSYTNLLFYILITLSTVLLFFNRHKLNSINFHLVSKAAIFSCVGLLVLISPYIINSLNAGPISFIGYDWHMYALVSDFLGEFSRHQELSGYYLENFPSVRNLLEVNVFGAFAPIAYLRKISGLELHKSLPIVQFSFYFVFLFNFYYFTKSILKVSSNLIGVLVIGLAIHPLLSLINSLGSLSQIMAMCMALLFFSFYFETFIKNGWPRLIVCSCLLWCVFLTYSHMVLFFIAPLMGYEFFKFIENKKVQTKKILDILLIVIISVLIGPHRLIMVFENSKDLLLANAGPSYPTMGLAYLFGLYFQDSLQPFNHFFKSITDIFVFVILAFSFKALFNSNRKVFYIQLSFLGISIGAYAFLKILKVEAIGYKMLKTYSFYLPFLYAIPFVAFNNCKKKLVKKILLFFMVITVLFSGYFSINRSLRLASKGSQLNSDTVNLSNLIEKFPSNKINVITNDSSLGFIGQWEQYWKAFFLRSTKPRFWVTTGTAIGNSYNNGVELITYSKELKSAYWFNVSDQILKEFSYVKRLNSSYWIGERGSNNVDFKLIKISKISNKKIIIRINSPEVKKIAFRFSGLKTSASIDARSNKATCKAIGYCVVWLDLPSKEFVEIEIKGSWSNLEGYLFLEEN